MLESASSSQRLQHTRLCKDTPPRRRQGRCSGTWARAAPRSFSSTGPSPTCSAHPRTKILWAAVACSLSTTMRCELTACDVAERRCCSLRRAKQVPSTAGKRWARMRTVRIAERQGSQWTTWPRGTLRQPRYFRSTTHPAADAARVRRDGDRRCQTMSGAGRHAWRPSRQRFAAPTDAAKISSLLPVKLQKEVCNEKVVDSRRPSPCCCSARAATLLASGHCASLWCEFSVLGGSAS
mmetsp:Transcript_12783/g.31832  ORF Transcript_12783/g.31832 Transcript_12783/m.31832 type:complete len:237 (-) Transcript_12783:124-834(-)